jgi:PadR family transcriptional regulator PadR
LNESEEWLDELVASWFEVYKKSATTLILLRIIDTQGPVSAPEIGVELERRSGWTLTERGLYRTLKRLASSDLLLVDTVPVARTGLRRNEFSLNDFGRRYLARIEAASRPTTQ